MPTARPRHAVTETEEIGAALDRAARHFPHLSARRKGLLLELVRLGDDALRARESGGKRTQEERLASLAAASLRRSDAIDWDVLEDIDRTAWGAD